MARAVSSDQFLIGDPLDLPAETSRSSVASLVALGVEPAPVPRDVIDLDRPAQFGHGTVEVDHRPVDEPQRVLADQGVHTATFERLQDRGVRARSRPGVASRSAMRAPDSPELHPCARVHSSAMPYATASAWWRDGRAPIP